MVVVVLEKCPLSLRGDLTKWLIEVSTGVYVGQVSARVRDNLWERICSASKSGRATMVFSKQGEQRFDFRVHNTEWEPVDFDGIKLMLKPNAARVQERGRRQVGFSNASKRSFARNSKTSKKPKSVEPPEYVVLDVETTGLDSATDAIIEIAALRVVDGNEVERFCSLVNPGVKLPDSIARLTGISYEELEEAPIFADIAQTLLGFVGFCPLVMHNASFDLAFLSDAFEKAGFNEPDVEIIDTLEMARKRIPKLRSYRLGDLCAALNLENRIPHRALEDCLATRSLFVKLIEI